MLSTSVTIEQWDDTHPRWQELVQCVEEVDQARWVLRKGRLLPRSYLLVALQAGEVVGFLRFIIQCLGAEVDYPPLHLADIPLTEAKIMAFGVREERQRQGIGTALQAHALRQAKALGCYQVRSFSHQRYASSHQVKLAMGFGAQPEVRGEDTRGVNFVMPLRSPAFEARKGTVVQHTPTHFRGGDMSSINNVLTLPVRWWNDQHTFAQQALALDIGRTAFVLVDCDGVYDPASYDHVIKEERIAPALHAARTADLKVIYFHNAPGGGGPASINRELHGIREDKHRPVTAAWKSIHPTYYDTLAPLAHEAEFQKAQRNGFHNTAVDHYLRTWNIDTLILVGFSLKSCLYHTCVGAHEHNYRVIVLRDATCPSGTKEYPDTLDPSNPEGGWMRYAVLRLIETNLGYTSTTDEFVQACAQHQHR